MTLHEEADSSVFLQTIRDSWVPTVDASQTDPCVAIAQQTSRVATEATTRAEAVVRAAIEAATDPLAGQRATLLARWTQARVGGTPAQQAEATLALNAARERDFQQLRPRVTNPQMREPNPFELLVDGDAQCWPNAARGSAWGLALQDAQLFPVTTDWQELWTVAAITQLVHVDAGGRRTTAAIRTVLSDNDVMAPEGFTRQFARANCCRYDGMEPLTVLTFDFDSDGERELFLRSGYGNEGGTFLWTELYRFARGVIEPYPRPEGFAITSIEDVNDDGRPDLLSAPTLDAGSACGSGFERHIDAHPLVAISLADGTFDPTAPAAKTYARRWCPSLPTDLRTVEAIQCARLWGRTAASLHSEIARRYYRAQCEDERRIRHRREMRVSEEFEALDGAAELPVFFTLTAP
jgi:hypothetical protein